MKWHLVHFIQGFMHSLWRLQSPEVITCNFVLDPLAHVMRTSIQLLHPQPQLLYILDQLLELAHANWIIRYFRFLVMTLMFIRIWCCLNWIHLFSLQMKGLAWRRMNIGARTSMELMASQGKQERSFKWWFQDFEATIMSARSLERNIQDATS